MGRKRQTGGVLRFINVRSVNYGTSQNKLKRRKTMEIVKVSEILDLVKKIHKDAQTAIHYLEGRSLVGEINRPNVSAEKKPRKKRTPKLKVIEPGMIIANILDSSLPEDKSPFFTKPKGRRKKALYEPNGIKKDDPPVDTSIEHFDRIKKA